MRSLIVDLETLPEDKWTEEYFTEWALEVSRLQYDCPEGHYRSHVDMMIRLAGHPHPSRWESWRDIVPLPAYYFKRPGSISIPSDLPERVWTSSGTSGQESRTPLVTTAYYDTVIEREFKMFTPTVDDDAIVVPVIPDSQDWPYSSLAYMFSSVYKPTYSGLVQVEPSTRNFTLNYEDIRWALSTAGKRQVVLYGTSYGFVKLFDYLKENNFFFSLSESSFMIDTGGFKGFVKPISRGQMVREAITHLGLGQDQCYNEYGMSEMSSQLWSRGSEPHTLPPWMRARVVSPLTLEDAERGLLVLYDLANVYTAMAIQTEDTATITEDGKVVVHGRVQGSEDKGCSLTASSNYREIL